MGGNPAYCVEGSMERYDLLVIGGGAAGMAAALAAEKAGMRSVLLVERDTVLGGILRQCFHHGFGRGYFGEDLTGPEYAERFFSRIGRSGIKVQTGMTVLRLQEQRALLCGNGAVRWIGFRQCVLAAGCREQTLGALPVSGTRPAGIFTAGTAQRLVNIGNYDIGDEIVILGSGDIGQIMARRFVLRGKRVVAMIEQHNALGGLARNRRECILAYHIPVILSATVDEMIGEGRISGVMVRHLDTGRRELLPCRTLVTALGLIPEQELIAPWGKDNLPPWLHICGNCDYVHEIVDSVTAQAEALGERLGKNSM